MKTLKINHGAVWVSVVLSFGLGFLWYDSLFGEQWMAMVELDMDNPPGAGVWITNLIASVTPVYVLAWLFTKLNVETGIRGATLALLITFTFNHLSEMTSGMFAQEPYALAWITGGFNMAIMTITGFVLGAWKKYEE